MVNQEVVKAEVKEAAKNHDGKLPCIVAQEIAKRLEVPARLVGQAADDLKIKIIKCELGCFE
ncbi:MAG: hypothetical protein PWP31_1634 [Clostridia bacterium]|nr:hypothetical protein [Clostridia bacterium]